TPSEAGALKSYLQRGGGLVFFLGGQVNIAVFNEVMHVDGKGIFPLRLLDFVGPAERSADEKGFSFNPLDYAHPIVQPFADQPQTGLLTTRIFRYVKTAPLSSESKARVAMAYENGDAAIVMGPVERGVVGVVTTSADLDWNNWAVSPSYLPLVQELVQQLAAGRGRGEEVKTGEPIVLTARHQGFEIAAVVKSPGADAAEQTVTFEDVDGVPTLRYPATDRVGVYEIRIGPPAEEIRQAAVNPWPSESDLARMTADDLREAFPGWDFAILDRWQNSYSATATTAAGAGEIHRLLLYAVLALLFLETLLAWKFGHHAPAAA
ncbi:MAG: BatA domain-containing protein, partial [Planctomycetia bacterium]